MAMNAARRACRPIVAMRWWGRVFFQTLDVMALSLLLIMLDCQVRRSEPGL